MGLSVWQVDPAHMTPYYNIAVCDALAQAGCRVHYVASTYLYEKDLPFTNNFEFQALYFRGLTHPRLLNYPHLRRLLRAVAYPFGHWQLLRQLRRAQPDILHIQWNRLPKLDAWLAQQVKEIGIPLVYTIHEIVPLFAPNTPPSHFLPIYQMADVLIVHTEENRRSFMDTYQDIAPTRLHIIPHIALEDPYLPADASIEQARQVLNLPADAMILLFFGVIKPYKGLDCLLKAFAAASQQVSTLHLVIAGHPENPLDKALLVEFGKQHSNVTLRLEYIRSTEKWQYHLAADVVIFPYRQIYQSGALLNAMTYGKAVIATNIGGLPETVDGNGWIVPVDDSDALADAMIQAASNRDQLVKMGQRSREIIDQRHSSRAIAQKLLEIYHSVQRP